MSAFLEITYDLTGNKVLSHHLQKIILSPLCFFFNKNIFKIKSLYGDLLGCNTSFEFPINISVILSFYWIKKSFGRIVSFLSKAMFMTILNICMSFKVCLVVSLYF